MQAINEARKKARITVRELCEVVGISRAAYYRKIKGQTEFTVKEIEAICRLLKVRPSIFFNHKVS